MGSCPWGIVERGLVTRSVVPLPSALRRNNRGRRLVLLLIVIRLPASKILNQSKPHKSCFRATLIIRNYRTILITRPSAVIIMLTQINRAPPLPSFSIDIFMEANISSRIQWRFITIRRIIRSSGKNKKFHSLNSTGCIFSSKNIPSSP